MTTSCNPILRISGVKRTLHFSFPFELSTNCVVAYFSPVFVICHFPFVITLVIFLKQNFGHMRLKSLLLKFTTMLPNPAIKGSRYPRNCIFVSNIRLPQSSRTILPSVCLVPQEQLFSCFCSSVSGNDSC